MSELLRFDAATPLAPLSQEVGEGLGMGADSGAKGWVHRPARLFVAGDYPDKNVTVGEADLDALIARFYQSGARCPVQLEHISTALDPLGYVVGLYRCGPELFGMLVFARGMDEHLQKRGVAQVSVGLTFERAGEEGDAAAFTLKEVSLVLAGRVPTALFLNQGFLTALSHSNHDETEPAPAPARFPVLARQANPSNGVLVAFSRTQPPVPLASPGQVNHGGGPLVRAPVGANQNAHLAHLASRWGVTEAGLRGNL